MLLESGKIGKIGPVKTRTFPNFSETRRILTRKEFRAFQRKRLSAHVICKIRDCSESHSSPMKCYEVILIGMETKELVFLVRMHPISFLSTSQRDGTAPPKKNLDKSGGEGQV